MDPNLNVTELLHAAATGDRRAATDLLPMVYDELRRLATRRLAQERAGQTLQATALVHEAYLRLVGSGGHWPEFEGRAHFFGACAEAMRRILVDNARRKQRVKHGGERQRVELVEQDLAVDDFDDDLLAVDETLSRFAQLEPQAARVVEMHFFAGMSIDEVAIALGVSRATAYRQWSYARAWLHCEMCKEA